MRFTILFFVLLKCGLATAQGISTAKPWTYWWWMGSVVTKSDITAQLERFKSVGLGGVHIIPIYGVKGYEKQSIPFLSPDWIDAMQHTVREGKRLGIGVDLTTGTGWPFGGPNVPVSSAAKNMAVKGGEIVVTPTKQKVKRAAPGGEGFVLDPFHKRAMSDYLVRFDSAFKNVRNLPRSMYMDSYEAYGANWTDDFAAQFKARRGYDIKASLSLLTDSTANQNAELVRIDYHQTLAELLLDRYAQPWTQWSKQHNFLTRYQAHGSPGNLLDLYATADIPETESFGTSRFSIPGLRVDPDYSIEQFGTPNALAMKFASSAAHFTGKKLVSSETGTWLANHFKVSLAQLKPQIDELFTAGINHIFYHGTNYSPENEAYPGWQFYASTNFGKTSHFAAQFPLINRYVERCQEMLQNSKPDQDILVYFPIHDLWATKAKSSGNIHLLEVHHVDRWLLDLPFGKLTQRLWKEGYTFDFVSDKQLDQLKLTPSGDLTSGYATYKTIVIPSSTYIPQETMQILNRLAKEGAKIIFDSQTPSVVTGYANHSKRQISFKSTLAKLLKEKYVRVSTDLNKDLKENGVAAENLSQQGLTFIRKKTGANEDLYFVSNLSDKFSEGWVHFNKKQGYLKIDPLQEESAQLASRPMGDGVDVYLELQPGQSCFLRSTPEVTDISNKGNRKRNFEIAGEWELNFLEGKPSIPASAKLKKPVSWISVSDSAEYFSGIASYKIKFNVPEEIIKSQTLTIDLGEVRESARIKLNGKLLGEVWSIPFRLQIDPRLLTASDNILEIEVTNLSANYMRLRDRQAPDWKKFYDINIVDITYKKFDASKWEPMPSGLLGPVTLIYN